MHAIIFARFARFFLSRISQASCVQSSNISSIYTSDNVPLKRDNLSPRTRQWGQKFFFIHISVKKKKSWICVENWYLRLKSLFVDVLGSDIKLFYFTFLSISLDYCPEYNTGAHTLDIVPCNESTGSCPDAPFLSNEVYKCENE